ncbi:hypothetical protein CL657_00145 [bacterium]|nr:hypothetical protein [bacterium]|tara:strand:- start:241 stop:648 length:408 start_codon:yes stop_codon:yes gene_type:complete
MENQNQNNIDIKQLQETINYTLQELETFKEIGQKRSNIIYDQDDLSKKLATKNTEELAMYKKNSGHQNIDKKITQLEDILFRNFDIHETSIEILKAYIDEYFDRFIKLQKSLSIALKEIEKTLRQQSNAINSKGK